MDPNVQINPANNITVDPGLDSPFNFNRSNELDHSFYASSSSISSSFSSAGPLTPSPSTPSSSRRPSTVSTAWGSQFYSESSSIAATGPPTPNREHVLFSLDPFGLNNQLSNVVGKDNLSFLAGTPAYGTEDPFMTLPSHGLPIRHDEIDLSLMDFDRVKMDLVVQMPDPFVDAPRMSRSSSGIAVDQCLSRAMFGTSELASDYQTPLWPPSAIDPSPTTIVPSQTITLPTTPQKQVTSTMKTPVKDEFASSSLISEDEGSLPPGFSPLDTSSPSVRLTCPKVESPPPKPKSRRRYQQQAERITTRRGVTYTVSSTFKKTPQDDPCMEWIPDDNHPEGGQHCTAVFRRSEHLSRHRRTHRPDEKKWPCPFPLCDRVLTRKDNLPPHFMTHRQGSGKGRGSGRNIRVSDEEADRLGLFGPKPSKQRNKKNVAAKRSVDRRT